MIAKIGLNMEFNLEVGANLYSKLVKLSPRKLGVVKSDILVSFLFFAIVLLSCTIALLRAKSLSSS